jgi:hypothetical protein
VFFSSLFLAAAIGSGQTLADSIDDGSTLSVEQLYHMLLEQQRQIDQLRADQSSLQDRAQRAEARAGELQRQLDGAKADMAAAPTPAPQADPFANQLLAEAGWTADVRIIYLPGGETGATPAAGLLGGPLVSGAVPANTQPDSHNVFSDTPNMDGGGVRLALLNQNGAGWFAGAIYEGHAVSETDRVGQRTMDIDNVNGNLISRSLADDNGLNGLFDDGIVDFVEEQIHVNKHTADLVVGKKIPISTRAMASWKVGARVATSDVERNVFYENVEAPVMGMIPDVDSARVRFDSEMWGVGPLVGAGLSYDLGRGFTISGDAAVSGVYAEYDLARDERNLNQSGPTLAFANIRADTHGVVPMVDASIDITKTWENDFYLGIGYMASAWLGGARSINVPGWDDIDDETSAYTIERDDIVVHGVYARAGLHFDGI